MVYCDGVEVDSKLGRLIQAFRCDRPSEWQMDEFIQMAEDMHKEITRLREAEKDAARYRWLIDNSVFGMKQNGVSWSLQFDGPAPEHSGKIGECIDQAMKEKGDE